VQNSSKADHARDVKVSNKNSKIRRSLKHSEIRMLTDTALDNRYVHTIEEENNPVRSLKLRLDNGLYIRFWGYDFGLINNECML